MRTLVHPGHLLPGSRWLAVVFGTMLLLLTCAVGGCAGHGGLAGEGPVTRELNGPVMVQVTNDHLDPIALYAVSSGSPMRIGTIYGGRTEWVRVPGSALGGSGQVTFVARFLYSGGLIGSGPVALRAGDRLALSVPSTGRLLAVLPYRTPRPRR